MSGLFHTEPSALGSDLFPCRCTQLCIPPLWAQQLSTCSRQINATCGVCSQLVPQGGLCTQNMFCFGRILFFGLCGQTADQRVSLLGKGSMVKLCEVLQAGGIQSALPSRELADFPLFFIYKSITIGHVESCNMLVSFGGINLVFR